MPAPSTCLMLRQKLCYIFFPVGHKCFILYKQPACLDAFAKYRTLVATGDTCFIAHSVYNPECFCQKLMRALPPWHSPLI